MTTIINLSRSVNGINDHICDLLAKEMAADSKPVNYIKTRDLKIDFCTNCRLCMKDPGNILGRCHIHDDMDFVIDALLKSECVVVSAPINCYDLPSIIRVMLERMGGFCYWNDEMYAPKVRDVGRSMLGILITTSAMPGIMVPFTTNSRKSFKLFAKPLGIKRIHYCHLGFKGRKIDMRLNPGDMNKVKSIAKRICNHQGQSIATA
ncbi:MAG TPA: NAD(P)H-dependent oxidoreductase [Deltaproteobacteria bacterium]|nr:NAD(P)H-dependent oxidoreductase [Deltaproteobacteria bacterium]